MIKYFENIKEIELTIVGEHLAEEILFRLDLEESEVFLSREDRRKILLAREELEQWFP